MLSARALANSMHASYKEIKQFTRTPVKGKKKKKRSKKYTSTKRSFSSPHIWLMSRTITENTWRGENLHRTHSTSGGLPAFNSCEPQLVTAAAPVLPAGCCVMVNGGEYSELFSMLSAATTLTGVYFRISVHIKQTPGHRVSRAHTSSVAPVDLLNYCFTIINHLKMLLLLLPLGK